ncbi:MAG: hypothetical protein II699_00690, partial [Lachnospiraceae bacterium]|nr:hypothetical protein [Lachnospiraceae bacterium]
MRLKKLCAFIITIALVIGTSFSTTIANAAKPKLAQSVTVLRVKDKTTLKIKNYKKKTKWSIKSGKSYISLSSKKKSSVVVTAKKSGASNKVVTAKVMAKAGSKKLYATFTILPRYKMESTEKTALKNVIKSLKSGSDISNNLYSEAQYKWDTAGHLVGLNWSSKELNEASIDLSAFPYLETVSLGENEAIGSVILTGLTKLSSLRVSDTQITTLDLSTNTALRTVDLSGTGIATVDFSKNLLLDSVKITDSSAIKSINLSNHTALTKLYCYNNDVLTDVNVSGCTALKE